MREWKQDKLDGKLKEDTHVSGAFIRSLVKQLRSSRTKDPLMKPKDQDCSLGGDDANLLAHRSCETQHTQPSQQPQAHKKLVRKRLRTSRPYQERLLNMAEERREIVTALKLHRAAMRPASEQHQQEQDHQQSRPLQPPTHSYFGIEDRTKSRGNPRIYPSSSGNFSNHMESIAYPSTFSHPPWLNAFYWSPSLMSHIPINENFYFTLPSQTLDLNLNFRHFNNTTLCHHPYLQLHQSSSLSSTSSLSLSLATDQGGHSVSCEGVESSLPANGDELYGGLRLSVDDEKMAEMKPLGEQHQMEWDDTVNLAASARWLRFLKSMEIDETEVRSEEEDWFHPFDEVMEFPAWLNANESCLQQHLDDFYSEDFFQDPALPCMDIGEIEGVDGEWLA